MFKIYQRYLASTFIPPFLLGTIFFSFFLLTFQIFRFIKFLVAKGISFLEVISLIGNMALNFLPMATPLAALLATLYSLGKLNEDSEIVALRSLGTSREKLFFPYFILAITIAITLFSLNAKIIPYSNFFVRNTFEKLASRGVLGQIRPDEFFTEIPGITLFAEGVEDGGRRLNNLFIFVDNKKEEKIVFARVGILKNTDDLSNFEIELRDGNILRKNLIDGKNLEKILFSKYSFPPFAEAPPIGFVNKDSMLSNSEIIELIKKKKSNLKTKEDQNSLYRTQLDYLGRFASPLQVILFVLLGFSLGIKGARGGGKSTVGLILLIVALYISLFFLGISFTKKGELDPFLATFGPAALLALVDLYYYRKMNWVS